MIPRSFNLGGVTGFNSIALIHPVGRDAQAQAVVRCNERSPPCAMTLCIKQTD